MADFLKRANQLAINGLGLTYPNPLVGAVIVHDDEIIGEGWHQKAGQPHAEVIAIQSVKNISLLQRCTLYVSLEPCSHFGKTPPCSHLILKSKIPKVVIGAIDLNPLVNGKGIEKLRNEGVKVEVMQDRESLELNKRFFTYVQEKRPYIFLKWAETADGIIGTNVKGSRLVISNKRALQHAHLRRSQEQAILIGKNTALLDNPHLNVRNVFSHHQPMRIVIDPSLELPNHSNVFKNGKTIVVNAQKNFQENDIEWVKLDFSTNILPELLNVLYNKQIQSLIVEGGAATWNSFIQNDLWDEIEIYHHPLMRIGKGIAAPKFIGKLVEKKLFGEIIYCRFKKITSQTIND